MYIAIEGIDTSGKSTQIQELEKYFQEAIITKEPGATEIGKEIREIVLNAKAKSKKAEFLLFLADRAEHVEEVVEPNLGKMIISDRSAVSGVAYALVQKVISEKDLIEFKNKINDISSSRNSRNRIDRERSSIIIKLKEIENEVLLFENNLGFFAKSKNADALIADMNKVLHQFNGRCWIKVSRWLICNQQFWIVDQCTSNGNTLLFSPG